MARFMTDAALQRYVERQVNRAMTGSAWGLRAGCFYSYHTIAANGLYVDIELRWTFTRLEADVDCENEFGMQETKTFTGDEALGEGMEWLIGKIVEVSKAVNARIAPYEQGKRLYDRALRGG